MTLPGIISSQMMAPGDPGYVPTPYEIPVYKVPGVFDTGATETSATIARTGSWEDGDYIVVGIVRNVTSAITPPSGFALLGDYASASDSTVRLDVFGGFIGSASSLNFTWSGSAIMASFARGISGIDPSDPFDSIAMESKAGGYDALVSDAPPLDRAGDPNGKVVVSIFAADASTSDLTTLGSYLRFSGFSSAVSRSLFMSFNGVPEYLTSAQSRRMMPDEAVDGINVAVWLNAAPGTRSTPWVDSVGLAAYLDSVSVAYTYAVLQNNAVVASGSGGDARTSQPMTLSTPLPIASVSKVFTEIAIRRLAQHGVLSLDDTVNDWLSGYTLGTNVSGITIRQLLAMTEGISATYSFTGAYPSAVETYMANNAANVGQFYDYDNGPFGMLQMIIEEASGDSYQDYVIDNIFTPAGITTHYTTPQATSPTMYQNASGAGPQNAFTVPATAIAGWVMPMNQLYRLGRILRTGGSIISDATRLEMLEDQYRASQKYSYRGGVHTHGGSLGLSGAECHTIWIRGTDGFDIFAFVNSAVSLESLWTATLAAVTSYPETPAFSGVRLLAGFNGSNGATTYTEESTTAAAATFFGTAALSTSDPKFGTASLSVTGNQNNYLTFPDVSGYDLTGPSTLRFWFKRSGAGGTTREPLLAKWNTTSNQRSWLIALNEVNLTTADLVFALSTDGTSGTTAFIGGNIPSNAHEDGNWHEIGLTHSGAGAWRIYFDGQLIASGSPGVPFSGSAALSASVLLPISSGSHFNGFIDEARISNIVEMVENYPVQTAEFPRS